MSSSTTSFSTDSSGSSSMPLRKLVFDNLVSATTQSSQVVDSTSSSKRPKTTNTANATTTIPTVPEAAASVLVYPKDKVSNPSRSTVEALFHDALQQANTPESESGGKERGSGVGSGNEQQALVPAGLLSFHQVLLPSVAHHENQALKQLQRVVQRDYPPECANLLVQCRHAIFEGIGAAMEAAEASRQQRLVLLREQRQGEKLKRQQAKEAAQRTTEDHKMVQQRQWQISRPSRLREQRKKLPQNQELYREHAFLMGELVKLEKEEKLWKEAGQALQKQQDEQQQQALDDEAAKHASHGEDDDDVEVVVPSQGALDQVEILQQELDDMTNSSIRIQNALAIVQNLMDQAEQTRQRLYHSYTQQEQFQGYPGVKNPKGLLRALSQSQTQSSQEES